MSPTWSGLAAALALFAAACQRNSEAQVALDPLGPVHCFQIASAKGLSDSSAIGLCAGASSAAPGQCYSDGVDRFTGIASQKIQQLCAGATSDEPLACYARLSADLTEPMSEDQMVAYCAPRCAGPPPAAPSAANCLDIARDQTGLPSQTAGELCSGSRSATPVQCFVGGATLERRLANAQLVQLCRPTISCQMPLGY